MFRKCAVVIACAPFIAALNLSAPAHAASYQELYSFSGGSDGANPWAGLTNLGGVFYGTSFAGGTCGGGTVFSITPAGVETVLHSFGCGGTGNEPTAGLINVRGTLYGTTAYGGASGVGTVFSITPAGVYKELYSFSGEPQGGLVYVGDKFYGTTSAGGACGGGTVFSLTPAGVEQVLHSFGCAGRLYYDGYDPTASLINVAGTLYGTTAYGGAFPYNGQYGSGGGTVFSITPAGVETVLHSFGSGGDGIGPNVALINFRDKLYGATSFGGAYNGGTVFSITPGGTEKVLHSFGNGSDGNGPHPTPGLTVVGGKLYGTTYLGGAYNGGTVFSITGSGPVAVLHSFGNGSDGANPTSGLINVGGTFYGTTRNGGVYGYGSVFALTPK